MNPTSPTPRHPSLLRGFLPLLLCGALGTAAYGVTLPSPASTALPTPTMHAKPAITPVAVSTNSSLEAPVLAAGSFKYQSAFTAAERTAAVWTMTGGSGISQNGSAFTSRNPVAPYGTQLALMQGVASMKTTLSLGATLYRLRYWAAQRVIGTVPNQTLNKLRVRIKVDGVEVDVETPAQPSGNPTLGAYAEYVTPPFWVRTTGSHDVEISTDNPAGGDNTVFIDNIRIQQLRYWSNAGHWYAADGVTTATSVPTASDHVCIDAGNSMVIWTNACKAGTVCVEGELLTGLTVGVDIALEARAIIVMGVGAAFEVGKPEFPLTNNFTLTLKGGNAATENLMGGGTNVLMAMGGGWIDMHGVPKLSWTRLSANVAVTASTITVADSVTWAAGDKIVIASSKQTPTESEERTIAGVSGTTISLTAGLTYAHLGTQTSYASTIPAGAHPGILPATTIVDERAEVGLLTHNVKILGDGSSTGGHVMIMKDSTCGMCSAAGGGYARVSNVEFRDMGQKQRMGRYPFHWHMLGDEGDLQYIKNCSIRNSRNRVLSIHGTNFARVEGNVAHDHIGHGIMLEDGSEHGNKIVNNLVLGTKLAALLPAYVGGATSPTDAEEQRDYTKNEAVLPTDNSHFESQNKSPATFWITHPDNTITGNVAAGTTGTGFWFVFNDKPTGLSYTAYPTLNPRIAPLASFAGNRAHSCSNAFDVNDGVNYTYDAANPTNPASQTLKKNFAWMPPVPAVLTSFRTYACGIGIYTGVGGNQRDKIYFDNLVQADNSKHFQLADYSHAINSLIVADSGNGILTFPAIRIVFDFYDGAGRMSDCHFVGFDNNKAWLYGEGGAASLHPNALFTRLTFSSIAGVANKPYIDFLDWNDPLKDGDPGYSGGAWGVVARDVDGSTTGTSGLASMTGTKFSIIPNHRMMKTNADLQWVNPATSRAFVSSKKFAHLRIAYPGVTSPSGPNAYLVPNVLHTRTGGGSGEFQPGSFTDTVTQPSHSG